jgi:hypothetical protein
VWLCTANATITPGSSALPWVKIGPPPTLTQTYSYNFVPYTIFAPSAVVATSVVPSGDFLIIGACELLANGTAGDYIYITIEANGTPGPAVQKTALYFEVTGLQEGSATAFWPVSLSGATITLRVSFIGAVGSATVGNAQLFAVRLS